MLLSSGQVSRICISQNFQGVSKATDINMSNYCRWFTCPRAHVPKVCQLFNLACQRANYSVWHSKVPIGAAQKMMFSIKYFFSNCGQICNFGRIWSHLLNKSLTKSFIFLKWGTPIFQLHLLKGVTIFQLLFKRIFQFLNFSIMLNICKLLEYLGNLSRETRNLHFELCKISLRITLSI